MSNAIIIIDWTILLKSSFPGLKEGNHPIVFLHILLLPTSQTVLHLEPMWCPHKPPWGHLLREWGRGVFSPLCRRQAAFDDKDVFLISQLSRKYGDSPLCHQGAVSSLWSNLVLCLWCLGTINSWSFLTLRSEQPQNELPNASGWHPVGTKDLNFLRNVFVDTV